MTTPVVITGFEYGVATPVSNAGGLFDVIVGAPAIQGSIKNTGGYALRFFATTSSTMNVGWGVSNPTIIVGRVYVRFAAWPDIDNEILYSVNTGAELVIKLRVSDHKLFARFAGAADGNASASALSLDTWYRVDFKLDVSANPSKIDFQVDGTAIAQSTYAQAATVFTTLKLGPSNAGTYDLYEDDFVLSVTPDDYPIGAGGTEGLVPTSDGTHNAGADVVEDDAGNDIGAVTAYNLVNKVPMSDASHYIRQAANGTGNYAAVNFANISAIHSGIIGASALLAYTAATTSGDNGGCIVTKDNFSTSTTIWGVAGALSDYSDGSTAAPFYKRAIVSGAVDDTTVNALAARLGYSGDANPDPYWINLMVEVAYTVSAGGTTYTETASEQAPHVASGIDATRFVLTGPAIHPSVAFAISRTINLITALAISARQASGADVYIPKGANTYTETGAIQAPHVAGGADQMRLVETTLGQAPHVGSAADRLRLVETGLNQAPHVGSAADRLRLIETTLGQRPHAASGSDRWRAVDTALSQAPHQVSTVDVLRSTNTVLVQVPHAVTGADVYIPMGAQTYTETSLVQMPHMSLGADRMYGIDTALSQTPHQAGTMDVLRAINTALSQAPHQASVMDVWRATDTTLDQMPHASLGADQLRWNDRAVASSSFQASGADRVIWIDSGMSVTPHVASGAAVYTPSSPAIIESGTGTTTRQASGVDKARLVDAGLAARSFFGGGRDVLVSSGGQGNQPFPWIPAGEWAAIVERVPGQPRTIENDDEEILEILMMF